MILPCRRATTFLTSLLAHTGWDPTFVPEKVLTEEHHPLVVKSRLMP